MRSSESETRPTPEADLPGVVARCREDGAALSQLREIYGRVDRAAAGAGVKCLGGGGCCKFDLAGHRLYLSGLELALLTAEPSLATGESPLPPGPVRAARMLCPYQLGPSCTAYERRPLGCRTFFAGRKAALSCGGYTSIFTVESGWYTKAVVSHTLTGSSAIFFCNCLWVNDL